MLKSKNRLLLVEREEAQSYLLISLAAFGVTVIGVRLFLQLTGFPQLGNGTLHIAHMLWGGLALFIAVYLVLIWDNPGALRVSAVLSGVGIGLFIDEVGKFITSENNYFFPPAAPIIYGFFLLTVFIYLYIRRPDGHDPRRAMIHALEGLQDAIYGELTREDVQVLSENLDYVRHSDQQEISRMAALLYAYVEEGGIPFKESNPGLIKRSELAITDWGHRLSRRWHRVLILICLGVIALSALLTLITLTWIAISPATINQVFLADLVAEAGKSAASSIIGEYLRIGVELLIGIVAVLAIVYFLQGNEQKGLGYALSAVILSLTALQLITFYLDQFTAVFPGLFQFVFLLLILAYQRWYLDERLPTTYAET